MVKVVGSRLVRWLVYQLSFFRVLVTFNRFRALSIDQKGRFDASEPKYLITKCYFATGKTPVFAAKP